MSVYTRPDSPFYWFWLETTGQRERTDILIGTTATQRTDSRRLAQDRYHQRMNELATRLYRLPSAQPAIRFTKYATPYADDVIAHRRGAERERELLRPLVAFFGDDLLAAIDQDRVRQYYTARARDKAGPRTINREVDLLKGMIRDAVPKYLTASPLAGMKRLHVVTPKRRLLAPAEERRLLRAADRTERALLLLSLDGLLRQKDALDIQRTDKHGPWLYVRDSKNGEPYEIALTVRAERALEAVPGTHAYYFQRYRGAHTARDRRSRVRRMLKTLCARAKVPYGKSLGGITYHWATRRTGASRLLVQGKVDIPTVQRQGDWKTADVLLAIYAESNRAAQLKAMRPLTARARGRRKRA